jgi:hypothetical protein
MRVIRAQFNIRNEHLTAFEAARDKVLSALSDEHPQGVRYTWCRLPTSHTFIGWLELDDGVENPLPGIAAGRQFQENMRSSVVDLPVREELEVIGTYRPIPHIPRS